MKRTPTPRRRMAGLTLLEILVAMMIGLIGIVVITQTYLVNENYKRSTTAAGGAQTNGALALYSIERDIRMSGWGITWNAALGCQGIRWHYNGQFSNPPGGPLPSLVVAPVVITDGGAGADTVTVFYGSGAERVIPATLATSMADSNAALQVDNSQGFNSVPGDLVLVAGGPTCSMMQLTDVNPATGLLTHLAGPAAPYNPGAAGTLPAFTAGAVVLNLGRPVLNIYSITAGNLQLASLFTAVSSAVVPSYTPTPNSIVEDIVDLQAEYGKDNGIDNDTVESTAFVDRDGRVDSYDNFTPATVDDWRRVLSIRLAVLARSEFYEKPDPPSAPCTATLDTNQPTWAAGTRGFPALGDLTDGANQARCYRYRVFETVVPLRNVIWRQEP